MIIVLALYGLYSVCYVVRLSDALSNILDVVCFILQEFAPLAALYPYIPSLYCPSSLLPIP